MNITDNEFSINNEYSHLQLDSTLLTEGTIIDSIAYCDNAYQAKTKSGKDYVGFNLRGKMGLITNATLFNLVQQENITKTLKNSIGKIVYVKGEVVEVKGANSINIITIDTCENSPFKREDFYPVMSNMEGHVELFKDIFKTLADYEYTRPIMEAVEKLRFLRILHDSSLRSSQMPIKGEGLVVCNKVAATLIQEDIKTEEGIDLGKIGAAMTILLLGTSLYIRDREDDSDSLISIRASQEALLIFNIINKFSVFGNNNYSNDLKTEFIHLRECYIGLSKPETLLSHLIPKLIETESSFVTMTEFFKETHIGNEYILDGKKICRCL